MLLLVGQVPGGLPFGLGIVSSVVRSISGIADPIAKEICLLARCSGALAGLVPHGAEAFADFALVLVVHPLGFQFSISGGVANGLLRGARSLLDLALDRFPVHQCVLSGKATSAPPEPYPVPSSSMFPAQGVGIGHPAQGLEGSGLSRAQRLLLQAGPFITATAYIEEQCYTVNSTPSPRAEGR